MARLPETFAQRLITARTPYTLPGFMVARTSPDILRGLVTVSHNVDRPFEIHRILPRPVGLDEGETSDPLWRWALQVTDYTKNQPFLKQPAIMASLVKSQFDASWEFAEPYYLERSEGLTFEVSPASYFTPESFPMMEVSIQGFLVNIAPATNRR